MAIFQPRILASVGVRLSVPQRAELELLPAF